MWVSTVFTSMTSRSAIARLREPLRHQLQHLALALGEPAELVDELVAAEQVADHLGVEHGAAGRDRVERVEQHLDVGHPVLEQVAEAAGVLPGQVGDVAALQRLGEQQDAEPGVALAELERRLGALVRVRRRHPDVDDRDVGCVLVDHGEQLVGVGGPGHDVDPRLGEQVGQAVAQQPGVVGDHDPHGSTASTVVPVAAAGDGEPPTGRLHPVAQAAQPGSVRVGAAAAVVVHAQPQVAVLPLARRPRCRARRRASGR